MLKPTHTIRCIQQQVITEARLFLRSGEAVILTFFVPMVGMALFVYLSREGMMGSVYGLLFRGLGGDTDFLARYSPITFMMLGMIVYCIIAAGFEGLVPKVVRERSSGLTKQLAGTPILAITRPRLGQHRPQGALGLGKVGRDNKRPACKCIAPRNVATFDGDLLRAPANALATRAGRMGSRAAHGPKGRGLPHQVVTIAQTRGTL